MIRAILAADTNWGIGKDGTMPWPHNSEDLKWFKECTLNSTVIMGRKTWDSLPFKPLPNRQNVVVSRQLDIDKYKNTVIIDIDTLRNTKRSLDCWIIGGSQLIETVLSSIDEIWISRINEVYSCDTFLPMKKIQKRFTCVSVYHETLTIEKWVKI